MKPQKIFLLGLLSLATCYLSACGGGSDGAAPGQAATSSQPTTVDTFDRSSDIKGPDADQNGVRDDVDNRIASYPLSQAQKAALTSYAKAMQAAYDSKSDDSSINASADAIQKGVVCSSALIPDYRNYLVELKAITLNTEERTKAHVDFQAMLVGRHFTLSEESECQQ